MNLKEMKQMYLDEGLRAASELVAALSVMGLDDAASDVMDIAARLVRLGARANR